MKPELRKLVEGLESKIVNSYEDGLTMEDAESLALEFLAAMMKLSKAIHDADLDARMKKSGLKAVRATIYVEVIGKTDKRPTVDALEHTLNADSFCVNAQSDFDTAEVLRHELERYYDVFRESHIHFRGIAKGSFQ